MALARRWRALSGLDTGYGTRAAGAGTRDGNAVRVPSRLHRVARSQSMSGPRCPGVACLLGTCRHDGSAMSNVVMFPRDDRPEGSHPRLNLVSARRGANSVSLLISPVASDRTGQARRGAGGVGDYKDHKRRYERRHPGNGRMPRSTSCPTGLGPRAGLALGRSADAKIARCAQPTIS
jgi:hypothetical protein